MPAAAEPTEPGAEQAVIVLDEPAENDQQMNQQLQLNQQLNQELNQLLRNQK